MDTERAKKLIYSLANGIDPFTGELFPREHVCNQPDIIRALYHILEVTPDKKANKNPALPNAGKPWTQIEEDKLKDEFDDGMKISAIAREHGRSRGSIESKLTQLGLIYNAYFARKHK